MYPIPMINATNAAMETVVKSMNFDRMKLLNFAHHVPKPTFGGVFPSPSSTTRATAGKTERNS